MDRKERAKPEGESLNLPTDLRSNAERRSERNTDIGRELGVQLLLLHVEKSSLKVFPGDIFQERPTGAITYIGEIIMYISSAFDVSWRTRLGMGTSGLLLCPLLP